MLKFARTTQLAWLCLFGACSGFNSVELDGSAPWDLPFAGDDAHPKDAEDDRADGALLQDGQTPTGKLKAGHCCAKHEECESNQCGGWVGHPNTCSPTCIPAEKPDTCPIGFSCRSAYSLCYPPGVGPYECGPQVANAKQQPQGGCCAKDSDCLGNECTAWGEMPGICADPCDPDNDTCAVGYACRQAEKVCAPSDLFNYTCTWY